MHGRGQQTPGFGIGPPVTPPVVKNLLIALGVIFVAQHVILGPGAVRVLSVQPLSVWQHGLLWQPFTYMWLHGGFWHIAFNMFALWMFGSPLAQTWGDQRFIRYLSLIHI